MRCAVSLSRRAQPTSRSKSSKSWKLADGLATFNNRIEHGIESMTFRSTAVFINVFRTVSTLFTVFGLPCERRLQVPHILRCDAVESPVAEHAVHMAGALPCWT